MTRAGCSCERCGEWFFIEEPLPHGTACPICEGKLRNRGPVKRDGRVWASGQVSVCDGRCTSAQGVRCDCQCGGRNHGSGRTVTISWVESARRLNMADTEALARLAAERLPLIRQAETLAGELVDRLEAIFGAELADYRAGRWVTRFDRIRAWQDYRAAIRHAQGLKTPKGRLNALRRINGEIDRLAVGS